MCVSTPLQKIRCTNLAHDHAALSSAPAIAGLRGAIQSLLHCYVINFIQAQTHVLDIELLVPEKR